MASAKISCANEGTARYPAGTTEIVAVLTMLVRRFGKRRLTVGADKNDNQPLRFVTEVRKADVTLHVTENIRRRLQIDDRTIQYTGHVRSSGARQGANAFCGWAKFNRPLRQTMLCGLERVAGSAQLLSAYYLVRLVALEAA